ncbi:two-component sensor histidine kinase [YclJ] [Brochothrix thermosphacta]|nr:two-component sensor histidine kinase [YclJ] [Brochothrix thermosphacta]
MIVMKIKYFTQLFLTNLFIVLATSATIAILMTHFLSNYVYEGKVDELKRFGSAMAKEFKKTDNTISIETVEKYQTLLNAKDATIILFDSEKRFRYAQPGVSFQIDSQEWENLKNGNQVSVPFEDTRFNRTVSFVLTPITNNNGTFAGGILLMSPVSETQKAIALLRNNVIIASGASLLIALVLSYMFSRFQVNRITKLQRATQSITSGDFDVQLNSKDRDEIGDLANDFDKMASSLKQSNEEVALQERRRRQFTVDVSHELRTPLTTISGVSDALATNVIPLEDAEESIRLIQTESKRLIRLVNENIDYERIRTNQVTLKKETFQLQELFEIVKDSLAFAADKKGDQITVDVSEKIMLHADYDRMTQVLINIVKNSIQFTDNGTVALRGYNTSHHTVIEVEDTGIGIKQEDIEEIWERFYKADISRTNTKYGESGIGLSIVKQLIAFHDGTVEVKSEEVSGTCFIIKLPLLTV